VAKNILAKALIAILVTALVFPMINLPVKAQEAPNGPWVDEVIFSTATDDAQAINMLEAEDAHAYFFALGDPQIFERVKASPNLWYAIGYGGYDEFTVD